MMRDDICEVMRVTRRLDEGAEQVPLDPVGDARDVLVLAPG